METNQTNETWNQPKEENKKILAGLLGIFLGGFGVHKFVLGYNNEGAIMLIISILGYVFSCFFLPIFGSIIIGVIGFIEGIIYLTKSDEDFYNTYQVGKRPWF